MQNIVQLENGYEISIVRNKYSYGGADGYFEIAIFKDGKFTTVPGVNIANDPVGWLRQEEVCEIVDQITRYAAEGGTR